ncbi:MAG: carboxypeptidase-like regulatory domain-containing protein, partial [Alphaproteobacteria bacterium]
MRTNRTVCWSLLAIGIALVVAGLPARLKGQQKNTAPVQIDNDDIGGVVTSAKGPEAGVWVIAETRELPTRFARMVVTDDQGRYVVPDLPKATYDVWVRGYGLVDSPKVRAVPGKILNLKAVLAPNAAAAARYYPAIYWYSMLKIPEASQFGGKSAIPAKVTQSGWINLMKSNGCVGCHQLGQLSTRTFPRNVPHPLKFSNSEEGWMRRVQSGQSGDSMINILAGELGGAPFHYFGDWTDRIAKGELPHAKPERPQGVERNIVVTTWDWLDDQHYLHDLIASDRRNPTVNAYGPLYGSTEYSTNAIPVLDPVKNTASKLMAPVRDAKVPEALGPGHAASDKILQPSPYWGDQKIWDTKLNNHNGMFDRKGRVWFAA